MPVPDAQTVVTKWQQRTSAAAQDYVDGARNTTKDPTALAVAAGQRYIQQVTDAFNTGRWARGLQRAGKAGWLAGIESKGSSNFQSGVAAATDKAMTAFTRLLAYEQNVQNQVAAMPNITAADRKARMNRAFDLMSAYKTQG